MNKSIMSEEAFNELIDGFEYVSNLTDYGRTNIKYHVQKLQQENRQLKIINKEYKRLDNGKPRGFVITRVDEYDIYDLLSYKENWNKLKEYIGSEWYCFDNESVEFEVAKSILNKMQELERGSESE